MDTIKKEHLLENVRITGDYLQQELSALQVCSLLRVPFSNIRWAPCRRSTHKSRACVGKALSSRLTCRPRNSATTSLGNCDKTVEACFRCLLLTLFAVSLCVLTTGLQSAGCGSQSLRVRPMLVFQPKHAAQFVDILERTLKQM